MNIKELENLKQMQENEYNKLKNDVEERRKLEAVQKYLSDNERLEYLNMSNHFIEQLEIGEDGTIFANKNEEKPFKYGLSFLFNSALTLKFLGNNENIDRGLTITYGEIISYYHNAQEILNAKKYYENEYISSNPYNIEVAMNPDNLIILDKEEYNEFEDILYNCEKIYGLMALLDRHNVNKDILYKSKYPKKDSTFLVIDRNIKNLELIDRTRLIPREQDAFFGPAAQEILGVDISKYQHEKEESNKVNIKK